MLKVELSTAKPGMHLALPVVNPQDTTQTLLKVGYKLTRRDINRLTHFRIANVWVHYPSLDFLEKFINHDIIVSQTRLVSQITHTFEHLQDQSNAKIPYAAYCHTISTLVSELISNPQAAIFLGDLATDAPDQLMAHSAAVAYISLLIGLKLEGYLVRQRKRMDPARAKQVTNLGVGAMLHDVGVTHMFWDVRDRYFNTGDDTDPEWRQHPVIGYELVRNQIEASASTVVLNHHQRFDGSGYAGKERPVLEGDRIHIFARIVALADRFDRLRHPVVGDKRPAVIALRELLQEDTLPKFDPEVVRALISVVPPYPPGSTVQLSDGRWAVCIDHVPTNPCRPMVQIIPDPDLLNADDPTEPGETIDLSEHNPSLCITRCGGHDVAELNFPPPPIMFPQSHLVPHV